jgi:hypothetical protein
MNGEGLDVPPIGATWTNLVLHLPRDWPWQAGWEQLFTVDVTRPP